MWEFGIALKEHFGVFVRNSGQLYMAKLYSLIAPQVVWSLGRGASFLIWGLMGVLQYVSRKSVSCLFYPCLGIQTKYIYTVYVKILSVVCDSDDRWEPVDISSASDCNLCTTLITEMLDWEFFFYLMHQT